MDGRAIPPAGAHRPRDRRGPIERVTSEDLMSLAGDTGTVPMQVGGVLFLRTEPDWDPGALVAAIAGRIPAVPRLRQRLHRLAPGLGRPVWQDDPEFSLAAHLRVVSCAGGSAAVLDLAADLLVDRLPTDRPLWAARVVTGFAPDQAAVVIVLHHVLADGVAALAILAALAGPPVPEVAGFPRPLPGSLALLGDNLRGRCRGLAGLPRAVIRLAAGVAVLRTPTSRALPTSLNRPTGRRRRLVTVWCGLDEALAAARSQQATLNDLVLAAIAEALGGVATSRGESLPEVVVSVPVSARRVTTGTDLGNQSGVLPLTVPTTGNRMGRLAVIASATRRARTLPAGASAALLAPWFRWLARLGLFRWFTDHQRLVHSFATNLRGPVRRLELGGLEVTRMVPMSVTTGNITAAFATLSYAGELGVTIVADPEALVELDSLRTGLDEALHDFLAEASATSPLADPPSAPATEADGRTR